MSSSLPTTGDQHHQSVAIQDQILIQQPAEQQQQQLYSVPVDTFAVGGVLDNTAVEAPASTFSEQPYQPQFHAEPQQQPQQVQVLEFHQQPTVTTAVSVSPMEQLQQVYFQPQQQVVQQQAQPQAVVLTQRDPSDVQNQQQQQQHQQQIVLEQQPVQDAIHSAPVTVTTVTEPPSIMSKAETVVQTAVAKPKRATRKKKDPNAPASVSSAYAFFFKDTQASVKTQNPNAKFGEVSKIVAQMWEAMGDEDKFIYKKKNEQDKVRYEREMTDYKERQEGQKDVSAVVPPTATEAVKAPTVIKLKARPVRAAAAAAAAAAAKAAEVSKSDEEEATAARPAPITSAPAPEVETTANDCIRQGCPAKAVKSPEWEDEYCSNKCVVAHCRDVFAEWVLAQKAAAV